MGFLEIYIASAICSMLFTCLMYWTDPIQSNDLDGFGEVYFILSLIPVINTVWAFITLACTIVSNVEQRTEPNLEQLKQRRKRLDNVIRNLEQQ